MALALSVTEDNLGTEINSPPLLESVKGKKCMRLIEQNSHGAALKRIQKRAIKFYLKALGDRVSSRPCLLDQHHHLSLQYY